MAFRLKLSASVFAFGNELRWSKQSLSIFSRRRFCNAIEKYNKNVQDEDGKKTNGHLLKKLYDDHIPTSLFQKTLLTVGSAAICITDPFRDDMIAVLGETTGYYAAQQIRKKMEADAEGQDILREMPRINSKTVDLDYLKSLPEGTFGRSYFNFLEKNRVTPDSRRPVHFVDDADLAYIIQRYREVHDLVHTLLGMPTNMLGEVTVKWVEAIQTGLPMCTAGALFGPLRFKTKQRRNYVTSFLPWALECGFQAKYLMNVYYERRWEQSIEHLREELNIKPPPSVK